MGHVSKARSRARPRLFLGAFHALVIAAGAAAPAAVAQPVLEGELVSRFAAPEANQGAAADARYVYAIDNSTIAKYDKATHAKVGEWKGDHTLYPHVNGCLVQGATLMCASSNYPSTPQHSTIEVLDSRTMTHVRSIDLGDQDGSITWVDRRDGFWFTGLANYDERGSKPGVDHRATVVAKFDDNWKRVATYAFPDTVLARFAPMSNSGGGFGPGGLLYISGHDRPEIYAMRLPAQGSTLELAATINVPIEGQSIGWDRGRPDVLYGITRAGHEVLDVKMPPVPVRAASR